MLAAASFWPTTHDILTPARRHRGLRHPRGARCPRLPDLGHDGLARGERLARPGAEEQIDNEKYEYKLRDWAAVDTIGIALLASADPARPSRTAAAANPHRAPTSDDALVCLPHVDAEHSPTGRADTVLVVVTIDPHRTREGTALPGRRRHLRGPRRALPRDLHWARTYVRLDRGALCPRGARGAHVSTPARPPVETVGPRLEPTGAARPATPRAPGAHAGVPGLHAGHRVYRTAVSTWS